MLNTEQKRSIIALYQRGENDTGTSEVQIALLTEKISYLQGHFKLHKRDIHSNRGLLQAVSNRRKLLKYLKRSSTGRYRSLISALGIRK